MRRRDFVAGVGSAAAWPAVARAQQAAMPVIGFLQSQSPNLYTNALAAFRQGLNEAGYVEGQNVSVEYRYAENQLDRLPPLAADLVRRRVAVIVAAATVVAQRRQRPRPYRSSLVPVVTGPAVNGGLTSPLD